MSSIKATAPAHLLVPFLSQSQESAALAEQLTQPEAKALLLHAHELERSEDVSTSVCTAHESFIAQHCGLAANKPLPYAALKLGEPGLVMDFCHWIVGRDHMLVQSRVPEELCAAEDDALAQDIEPLLAEDGLRIARRDRGRWLVAWPEAAGLECFSPEAAHGQPANTVMPRGPAAKTLRRLMNELQMLLYTHAINDGRRRAINSVWCWGAGEPAAFAPRFETQSPAWYGDFCRGGAQPLEVLEAFSEGTFEAAYAALNLRLQSPVERVTLCGSARYITLQAQPRGFLAKLLGKPNRSMAQLVQALCA